MKAYYVITTSKDRIGNRSYRYRVMEAKSKAEIRRRYKGGLTTVRNIYTKEQIPEGFEKNWL